SIVRSAVAAVRVLVRPRLELRNATGTREVPARVTDLAVQPRAERPRPALENRPFDGASEQIGPHAENPYRRNVRERQRELPRKPDREDRTRDHRRMVEIFDFGAAEADPSLFGAEKREVAQLESQVDAAGLARTRRAEARKKRGRRVVE